MIVTTTINTVLAIPAIEDIDVTRPMITTAKPKTTTPTSAKPKATTTTITTAKPKPTTTTKKITTTSKNAKPSWKLVGSNTECDAGAGEVYHAQSSAQRSSLEQCKQSCQDEPACKSITYFTSGWCSHFSTACAKTKSSSNAVAMQLSLDSASTATPTKATGGKRTWKSFGANTECDAGAGEVYHAQSSAQRSSLEQCKQSCQDEPACKSITYFA